MRLSPASAYPGPQPGDPPQWGWRELSFKPGAWTVVLPCALCGRGVGPHTSDVFYNLHAPLGRQLIIAWHPKCYDRDPLKSGTYWPRDSAGRWGELLRAVAERGPGRLGPGHAHNTTQGEP